MEPLKILLSPDINVTKDEWRMRIKSETEAERMRCRDKGECVESRRGGPVVPQGQRPGGCAGACLIQIAGALKL